jgi:hypothetical protein
MSKAEVYSLLEQGEHPGLSIARASDFCGVANPERPLIPTIPFTLLPPSLFAADRWSDILQGHWQHGDHITIKESRTVNKLLLRLASFPTLHDSCVFALQDNRPTAGSMRKGRGGSFALNRIIRQKAGICLAAAFRLFMPWVESKLQPADELSRL